MAWANRCIALGVLSVVALSCDDAGTLVPPPVTTHVVDLGGGVTATLGSDGSFSLASGGMPLVATAPGVPLFVRAADPLDPDGWHDPTKVHDDLTSSPIDLGTVGATADADASTTRALHLVIPGQPADTALLTMTLADDGSFVTGLGEQFDHVSARGRVSPMFLETGSAYESDTNEAHVPVPFLVSSRGWGVFVASREAGAFDVGATTPGVTTATFEGRALDVWFYVDPDPLAVAARFARQTGLARPLPRWALSPFHWGHWPNTDAILAIANYYRSHHIPASTLWLDDGWQTGLNTFALDKSVFSDPAAMMTQLQALGFRVLAWSTPYEEAPSGPPKDEAQMLFQQAAAGGFFVEDENNQPFVSPATPIKPNGGAVIDFTNAGATAFWDGLVGRATSAGIHGFKIDYGEDFIPAFANTRIPIHFSDGTTTRTARLFPLQEHHTYHAGLDAAFPGDGLLIVRASAYGGASEADVVWPGDLDSGFQHHGDPLPSGSEAVGGLPAVVVDVQTLAASGFPAFGSDTAGYRGDPNRESLLRWVEHTALTVVMQLYGDGNARQPWTYDADAAAEYTAMTTLHQRLEPYNALLVRAASTDGTPTVRALPLAFPGDAAGPAHADDEYMLGPDLLVAPVIEAGATTRAVHLPPGSWVHWWSDATYAGPADVMVAAPLGQPPLFARAGGLVPMLPNGIDTLVDATAPGVVTAASQAAHVEARAWAAGTSSVMLDDGSSISVDDAAPGIDVAWAPGGAGRDLFVDVDLRVRANGAPAPTTVATLSGAALAPVADEAAVRAAQGGAWAIDATKGHAWLRLPQMGSARLK